MEQPAKVGEGLTDGELHEQTEKGFTVIAHHHQLSVVVIFMIKITANLVVWGMNPTRLPGKTINQKSCLANQEVS